MIGVQNKVEGRAESMRKNMGRILLLLTSVWLGVALSEPATAQKQAQTSKISHVHRPVPAGDVMAGDAAVDRLNDAQLTSAYRGPVYYPGQPVPQAQPVKLGQNQKVEGDATGDVEVDRLNDAQIGAAYKGPVYYAGHLVPQAQPVRIGRNVPVALPEKTTLAGDANGDDKVDLLNASQIGEAYKGPVYYPGQPVPSAKSVRIATVAPPAGHGAGIAPAAPVAATRSVLVVAPMAAPVAMQTMPPVPACAPASSVQAASHH